MIALDVEDSVPTCAIILERDLRAQLHQLFLGKLLSQTRVLAENSTQLFIAQVCFSAHGRIDIYSERTIDALRGADLSKLNVTQRDKPFAGEPCFHGDAAPHERRQTHLNLDGRKILSEYFTHHAVEPSQMPRCLVLLQAGNSSHAIFVSYRATCSVLARDLVAGA